MVEKKKVATLSKGRASWCMIFRHPICKAADGRNHLRIRRGLATRDKAEAEALVSQMNEILGDPSFWKRGERERALQRFDPKIVSAFYECMAPPEQIPWGIHREEVIPLPGGKNVPDGYARVQLIGTTGAGKTTVLRQLIGTDPLEERFPSISAAKTTVCDIEVIMDGGPFRAVVSFIDRDLVRQYIADCVSSAITCVLDGRPEREVSRSFLEHAEQRFRLSYLLGTLSRIKEEANLSDDDDEDDDLFVHEIDIPSDEERDSLSATLRKYLDAITALGRVAHDELVLTASKLGIDIAKATQPERDTLEEIVEDEIRDRNDYHTLVDAILDDVESRFALLTDGDLIRGRDGWPRIWKVESDDRRSFIRSINRFSSNYAPSFGQLLTPLVEGIRVAGPFCPTWRSEQPKLVLLDGQGLGHKADSVSSISTNITRRYQIVDAIVLVDNGAQPMQAAPCAALDSIVSSGHESKLIVCFTHFDEVRGDNLPDLQARTDHVLGSFYNAANAIAKTHGRDAGNALQRAVPNRIVFLSGIQKKLKDKARLTRHEFDRLLDAISQTILPAKPVEYTPVYDVANLVLSIQSATQEFHDLWHGILSMRSRSGVAPEHWTRVKALSRRLGIFRQDEYSTLKPVADLIRLIQNHLSTFLADPLGWCPHTPAEEDESRTLVIDSIRTEVFTRLHELAHRRILDERFTGWIEAFEYRGKGSTLLRARDIVRIYESAAPVPKEMPGPDSNKFLFEIRELVADSINAGGGRLKGWTREDLRLAATQTPTIQIVDKADRVRR